MTKHLMLSIIATVVQFFRKLAYNDKYKFESISILKNNCKGYKKKFFAHKFGSVKYRNNEVDKEN